MAIKVGFLSLGCPKNQLDLELMLARVVAAGYEIVEEDIHADVMIVNTCAFIQSAKEESIEAILDLGWLKENRHLRGVVVTGCLAQRYFDQIQESLPEVDAVLALGREQQICQAIEAVYRGEKMFAHGEPQELCLEGDRVVTTPDYTAYLRVAEGCDNCCSYCAIPQIRGPFRSRRMEDILAEARTLRQMGVKELCLVAQDTTRYGEDLYGEYSLDRLLTAICEDPELDFPWIRLFYCYPDKITQGLVEVMAKYPAIVPYIDMPIQHISDNVLKRMNRHGGSQAIVESIERLRRAMPDVAIRTTALVGFSGETGKDFEELLAFVKQTRFRHLGCFAYSREENTPAYGFDGRVSQKVKDRRVERIMEAQAQISLEYGQEAVGQVKEVLCEGYDPVSECWFGRSREFAPEIDGRVYFHAKTKPTVGEFVSVKITQVLDYDLVGETYREEGHA